MERESGRTVMERRYGEVDTGSSVLAIAGREFRLKQVLSRIWAG